MMNIERGRWRTPFKISVRMRSSTFFLILPIQPAGAAGGCFRGCGGFS
uniref:Uncharacterized protein n=1 Tax=Arundo donax TaxID=35708 RepID=A0A0A9G554_ARUDO